ncbi:MAG: MBL fold metallo-hydrolase, partial [Clostridia bacterium]|nr:MBL fold metallo-hydrolase [Clostridia bacterium]
MNPFQEGKVFYACGEDVTVRETPDGATHVFRSSDGQRLSGEDLKGGVVFGGGKGDFSSRTSVTMESGFLFDLYGGSLGGRVENAKVILKGGLIHRYVFGGGKDDVVGKSEVLALGGVVRHSLFGAGESEICGEVKIFFDGTLCTNLRTGSRKLDADITDNAYFTMKSGHIFDLALGGANQKGDVFAEICGGTIEQKIQSRCSPEKIHLKLYENAFVSDGHEGSFPRLPEGILFSRLPKIEKETVKEEKGSESFFFDTKGEKGKLIFRFFSMRNPLVPKTKTPFSDFIGDSFLISFPSGDVALVDTGMPYSYQEIYESLLKLNIQKIDYLILTHPHEDHVGNAERILRDFKVSNLMLPDFKIPIPPKEVELQEGILKTAKQRGVKIQMVGRGDRFQIGKGDLACEILVLNPKREDSFVKDLNGVSIAFKIKFRDQAALLTGDITDREEAEIVDEFSSELRCDLLKSSHHGIVYQNSYDFILACSPEKVVIQNARDQGAFVKITSFALEKQNGILPENIFVTGKHGKIKASLSGEGDV